MANVKVINMIIEDVQQKDEPFRQFEKREWAVADKEHYGQPIDWDTKSRHYLKATSSNGEVVGILHL